MGYSTSKSSLFKIDAKKPTYHASGPPFKFGEQRLSEVKITATKPLFERKTDKLIINVDNSSLMTEVTHWKSFKRLRVSL